MSLPMRSLSHMPAKTVAGHDEFATAARLLQSRTGMVLGDHKRDMVLRLLGTRAAASRARDIADYIARLAHDSQLPEWDDFISAFTINHTAFFRERHHFDTLAEFAATRPTPISVWCCAASTGEEAYTIAMTLHEAAGGSRLHDPIWATDIDTHAIAHARAGIYAMERAQPIPESYLKKYFYQGRGAQAGMVRVKPVIRNALLFEAFNLLAPEWPDKKFDAIFCRNTMIYFDRPTQTRVLQRFAPMLKPGGLLFAGHSENFTYLTDQFRLRGQTVYERVD